MIKGFRFLRVFSFLFRHRAKRARPSKLLTALFFRAAIVVGALVSGKAVAVGGGTVVEGAANIQPPNAGQTVINQSSQNAVINWDNFNIGQGERVQFIQPGVDSAALNRVLGPDPTQILGELKANGRIFIVNPSGIVFGQGASVDVGGLVASSLGMNNSDFMAGKLSFGAGSAQPGQVLVQPGANITAQSFVALLGNSVSNEGSITAGKNPDAENRGIALVGADAATIQLGGWNVQIDKAAREALVKNAGELVIGQSQADGSIQLNAAGRNALMGVLLTNTGKIQNQSHGVGSETSLESTGGVLHAGDISALSGKVEVRGSTVELAGNVTAGDDKTENPVFVEIGGANTERVTQGVDSVVTANSKADAQINIAAEKVLALSGALFAPGGEISLASTILDTGLLVPVADKINQVGVQAWMKLPLKTSSGLAVYFGVDGHVYSEDGLRLAGAEHLYDEQLRDVGVVGDIDSEKKITKSAGDYYDGGRAKWPRSGDLIFSLRSLGISGEVAMNVGGASYVFKQVLVRDGYLYLITDEIENWHQRAAICFGTRTGGNWYGTIQSIDTFFENFGVFDEEGRWVAGDAFGYNRGRILERLGGEIRLGGQYLRFLQSGGISTSIKDGYAYLGDDLGDVVNRALKEQAEAKNRAQAEANQALDKAIAEAHTAHNETLETMLTAAKDAGVARTEAEAKAGVEDV
ncbi:filamentous hemagglutinin N-terminal domain-containing protein, partial [Burkholderia multivorans]|nr:filamentous hemagglutinin N-terminal domain-containing protein [Burkholderia multivorans]